MSRAKWPMVLALVVVTTLVAPPLRSASAAEKLGNSLDLIPADATLYSTALRNKEQLDALLASNAWAKLKAMPGVVMARQWIEAQLAQPGNPASIALGVLQLPENQELIQLLGDMGSHEVFVYGDESWLGFVDLMTELNGLRYRSMLADIQELRPRPYKEHRAERPRLLMDVLNENIDSLSVPNLVFGFKISDRKRAETQLKRLEVMAGLVLNQTPLKGRLTRVPIAGGDFLKLSLDGELVPWDAFWPRVQELEEEPGEFDELLAKLKQATFELLLGTRDDYLLVSIGSTTTALEALGKGDLLVDRDELGPLKKFLNRRISGVGYLSADLQQHRNFSQDDVDGFAELGLQILDEVPLDEGLKERIGRDIKRLAEEIKPYVATPAARLSVSLLTDRGFEHFTYDWTENLLLDTSKPLGLVSHLGGSPILALVTHAKGSPKQNEQMLDWIKVFTGYAEEIGVAQLRPADQEKYKQWREALLPLVKRADVATRTMLLPGLADGQTGLVLDAKITSRQWHKQMPMAKAPLPMVELALVVGVSDAELVRKAFVEYKAIADEALAKLKELNPGKIPADFKLPDATSSVVKGGTIYSYTLPKEAQLDAQLAPNAGLGEKVAVLSLAPKHTERLMAAAPLAADGPLGDTKRPLASIGYFNWAALVDAALPWVEYGVRAAAPSRAEAAAEDEGGAEANENPQAAFVLQHVRTVAEVLKCLRTLSSVTYTEEGALVTHTEWHFEDVK